jgi:hypothetical protein
MATGRWKVTRLRQIESDAQARWAAERAFEEEAPADGDNKCVRVYMCVRATAGCRQSTW